MVNKLKKFSTDTDCIYLLFLFFAILFFFKEALFYDSRTIIYDTADQFYPYLFYVSSMFRKGELPLWNPFLFNGYPAFANIQGQSFYPVNFLFILFSKFTPYLVQLQIILHYFLAGVFMYLLSRSYLKDKKACFLSALAYMFSGYMVGHTEHLTQIGVITWFPLVFLLTEKAITNKNPAYIALAALFLGILILAGHPQTAHAACFVIFIHAIYRAVYVYRTEKKPGIFFKSAAVITAVFIIGILIAAIQILPTYELVGESNRSGALTWKNSAESGQLSIRDAILLIIPNYFGAVTGEPYWGSTDISQNIMYIGVIPLSLIGICILLKRKQTHIIYFFLMAVFFLLVSTGANGVVYRLLYEFVPGFDRFRSPVNLLFIYIFFATLLAGYGFNALNNKFNAVTIYSYLILFFISGTIMYFISPSPSESIISASKNMSQGFIYFTAVYLIFAATTVVYMYYPKSKNIYFIFLLLLTYSDLHITLSDAEIIGTRGNHETYEKQPPFIEIIKKDSGIKHDSTPHIELDVNELRHGLFRFYAEPKGTKGTKFVGYNRALLHRVFLVEGYDPLVLRRHKRLVDVVSQKNLEIFLQINNVKYFAAASNINNYYQLLIYKNYLPRAFIVGKTQFMETDDDILDELSDPSFKPSLEVIISGENKKETGKAMSASDWDVSVSKYAANEVKIQAISKSDSFLVLLDTYYPGWQVWVDGKEKTILRANYDFRAVHLPAGKHTVIFKFRPKSFVFGMVTSLCGLLLVGIIGLIAYRRSKKPKPL